MVKCHLSELMGKHKMKIADVARETRVARGVLSRLYNDDFTRVDMEVVETLCRFFDVQIGDFFSIENTTDVV